jgi:hypothetical protein
MQKPDVRKPSGYKQLKFGVKSSSWTSPSKSDCMEKKDSLASNHSDSELLDEKETEDSDGEYVIETYSSPEREEPAQLVNSTPTRKPKTDDQSDSGQESGNPSPIKFTVTSSLQTTANEGFLGEFYSNSRLHLISTWKRQMQDYIAACRKDPAHKFPLLDEYERLTAGSREESLPSSTSNQSGKYTYIYLNMYMWKICI